MNLKNTLKSIKLNESTISMILGAILVIIVGILIVSYFSKKSGKNIQPLEIGDEKILPTIHVVSYGEDLWKISERYYGAGFNWIDIAEENNISNPNMIEKGESITIPDVKPRQLEADRATLTGVKPSITSTLVPAKSSESITVHQVTSGEDLWKIAEKYYDSGYNWVDIAKVNNIISLNKIEIGEELIIPSVDPRKRTVHEPLDAETADPISGATYTVIQGDSLWKIAVRAYGDGYRWVDISRENSLLNPDIIHPGNILTLPK